MTQREKEAVIVKLNAAVSLTQILANYGTIAEAKKAGWVLMQEYAGMYRERKP